MALPQQSQRWTAPEYLVFERESDSKHEFIDGEIVAMSGASREHNKIVASTLRLLGNQLSGKPCSYFASDLRVRIPDTNNFMYPDISVVCGEDQYMDDTFDTLVNPTVVIEVLSPTTVNYDRGKKFENYWKIASLQSYVLIAQDKPRIERFTRQESKQWLLTVASGLDDIMELPSVNSRLALREVYEQISFDPPPTVDMTQQE